MTNTFVSGNTQNIQNKPNFLNKFLFVNKMTKRKQKNQMFKNYSSLENTGTLEEIHFHLSIKAGKLLYNPINFILGLGTQKQAYR